MTNYLIQVLDDYYKELIIEHLQSLIQLFMAKSHCPQLTTTIQSKHLLRYKIIAIIHTWMEPFLQKLRRTTRIPYQWPNLLETIARNPMPNNHSTQAHNLHSFHIMSLACYLVQRFNVNQPVASLPFKEVEGNWAHQCEIPQAVHISLPCCQTAVGYTTALMQNGQKQLVKLVLLFTVLFFRLISTRDATIC